MPGAQEAPLNPHALAVLLEEEVREQAPIAILGAARGGELDAAADDEIAQRGHRRLLWRPGFRVWSHIGRARGERADQAHFLIVVEQNRLGVDDAHDGARRPRLKRAGLRLPCLLLLIFGSRRRRRDKEQ